MPPLDSILKPLSFYKRHDLVRLLQRARLEFDESDSYGSLLFSRLTRAEIYAPVEDCEKLRSLPQEDRELILHSLLEIFPPRPRDVEINQVEFYVDPGVPTAQAMTDEELIREVETQRNLMVAVATGGPRIQSLNTEYQERRDRIRNALEERDLRDPNPYHDLWEWYGKWSNGDLSTWQSRRQYISELYTPLLERLKKGPPSRGADVFVEPTGWAKVDRGIDEIRKQLEEVSTTEQFQIVGLLCRETLISLAQTAYIPKRHSVPDGISPSKTDAKRLLEAYLEPVMSFSDNAPGNGWLQHSWVNQQTYNRKYANTD